MARRNRSNQNSNPFEETRDPSPPRRPQPKKRRRWPFALLLLILLIGLLPNLLGWTGLHQTAINYVLSDFKGKVTVEKASLGWFQPIALNNIAASDDNGNELLAIESVTTSKPLYAFLTSTDFGKLNAHKPTAYIQLRHDGSNFEDALASYMMTHPATPAIPTPSAATASSNASANTPAKPTNSNPTNAVHPTIGPPEPVAGAPLPKITINITEGRALISSPQNSQTWQIENFQATIDTLTENAPLTIESACQIFAMQPDAAGQRVRQAGGNLTIKSAIDPGSKTLLMHSVDLEASSNQFPISVAAPVLQRFIGPTQSSGQLTGSLQSKINLDQQAMAVQLTNLGMTDLDLVAPELLGSDRIRVNNLTTNGYLELSPKLVSSTNFQLNSDFGDLQANGRFNIDQINALATGEAMLDSPLQIDGQIDLAALVRMLPSTLQLHEDLQIDSGSVRFQAGTKNEEGMQRLVMNLDTANLKARRGSQNIVWQKPLRFVATVIQSPQGMAVENLLCESDFLSVAGSATWETGAFRARGNIAKLMEKAGEFIDLTGTQLAGELDGNFGWQTAINSSGNPATGQPMQIGGTFVVSNPFIQFPSMPVWQQPKLSVKMSASGHSLVNTQTNERVLSLEQGGVQLEVGEEQAIAVLAGPVANAFNDSWNLNCQLTGGFDGWLKHIQNFVDLGDVQGRGAVDLTCGATVVNNQLQLTNIEYTIGQMMFAGYGLKIREPNLAGTAVASYDLDSGTISIADTTLTGNAFAARGQNLTVAFPDNMRVDGAIAFRADVNRVADWFEISPTDDSVFWFGSAEGTIHLVSNKKGIGGRLNSTISDLVAAQRSKLPAGGPAGQVVQSVSNGVAWTELFRESKTQLDSDLLLANDFNAIQFQNLALKSSALQITAEGSIAELAETMVTNIQGTWTPDWRQVQGIMAAYIGDFFQLSGSGEQPFTVRGPLLATSTGSEQQSAWVPPQLQTATSIRWDQGNILGVPVGGSELRLDVRDSLGRVTTTGIPFSGGVVQFAPTVDMRGDHPELVMDKTRLIDNVSLSPETARQWLKYVAPLAADATSAQGNFTLDVQQLQMPLMDPLKMEAVGALRLSNVVIGAGPLADQLLGTITQLQKLLKPESADRDLKTWLRMSEQTIPVMVKDQKVYHDGITFTHKDTTLRTRGSVGFDQSLNMMAEIPIADDWINGKSYLAGLKGQSISIPISGTVTQPKLDKKNIEQLTTQLVKSAAGNAINQAIADKVAPKVGEYQNQVNDKINNEFNKLQDKLGEKLGGAGGLPNLGGFLPGNGSGNGNPGDTGSAQPTNAPAAPDVGKQLEGELLKGFGNLFSGKK